MDRRRFILSAGLLAFASRVRAADPMTACVIGHTGGGNYGHGLDVILDGLPGVRIVAVADPDPAGREKVRQQLRAEKGYADYRQMLAAEKPALVSIAPRWSKHHFDMARAALSIGAHVVCEKPFTVAPREADELLELAVRNNLRIAVTHQMRMAPNVQRLREQVAGGAIGELLQMRSFGKQDARAGGEDMIVLGTHLFDLMRSFAGDAKRCAATIWSRGALAKTEDRRPATEEIGPVLGDEIEAQFEFEHGVIGTFTSRGRLQKTVGRWRLELMGSKGTATIFMDIDPDVALNGQPLPAGPAERGTPAANRRLAMDWLQAIAERREPVCSGANAAKAVEMAMAVYEAHLGGRRVEFPLARREHPLAA